MRFCSPGRHLTVPAETLETFEEAHDVFEEVQGILECCCYGDQPFSHHI